VRPRTRASFGYLWRFGITMCKRRSITSQARTNALESAILACEEHATACQSSIQTYSTILHLLSLSAYVIPITLAAAVGALHRFGMHAKAYQYGPYALVGVLCLEAAIYVVRRTLAMRVAGLAQQRQKYGADRYAKQAYGTVVYRQETTYVPCQPLRRCCCCCSTFAGFSLILSELQTGANSAY
jgi:hypothetical protein